MIRFFLLIGVSVTLSFANGLAALLIIPSNAKTVAGFYGGVTYGRVFVDTAVDQKISSTDPLAGVFIGLENSVYRILVSFEGKGNSDIERQRILICFSKSSSMPLRSASFFR